MSCFIDLGQPSVGSFTRTADGGPRTAYCRIQLGFEFGDDREACCAEEVEGEINEQWSAWIDGGDK